MKRWLVGAMVLCCGTLGLAATATPARATNPGINGDVVVEDGDSLGILGPGGQYVGDIPGFPSLPSLPYSPQVSPDGKTVAFWTSDPSCAQGGIIYSINLDGSGFRQLTGCGYRVPSWSPNQGQLIAQYIQPNQSSASLVTMNADGSGVRQLHVPDEDQGAYYYVNDGGFDAPIYSKDGHWIYFAGGYCDLLCSQGDPAGKFYSGVLAIAVGGGIPNRLIDDTLQHNKYGYSELNLSPDGNQFVLRVRSNGSSAIETYSLGSGASSVVAPVTCQVDPGPVWSPDATKILFAGNGSNCNRGWQFTELNPDGTDAVAFGPPHSSLIRASWGVGTPCVNDCADISTTLASDAPPKTRIGAQLDYTATISNAGPAIATNVTFGSFLPDGLVPTLATPSQGAPCDQPHEAGDPFACNLGTLSPGGSATVEVSVSVTAVEPINFAVDALADQPDTDLSNNSSWTTLSVLPPPAMPKTPPRPGHILPAKSRLFCANSSGSKVNFCWELSAVWCQRTGGPSDLGGAPYGHLGATALVSKYGQTADNPTGPGGNVEHFVISYQLQILDDNDHWQDVIFHNSYESKTFKNDAHHHGWWVEIPTYTNHDDLPMLTSGSEYRLKIRWELYANYPIDDQQVFDSGSLPWDHCFSGGT